MSNIAGRIGLIVFLAAILVLDSLSARHDTLTYDEPIHFRYGSNILSGDASRFIDGTMPFSALNALPQRMASSFPPGPLRNALAGVETGRFVTILFSMLLAYYVFKWTKELYGTWSGLFSLLIYTVSPNIIAHARLITTDVYAAGMVTISAYYFWRFLNAGGWWRGAVSALLLGVSQLAKYSCIFLYPIFVLIVVVRYWGDLVRAVKAGARAQLGRYIARFLKFAILFAVVGILVIDAGFLFTKSSTPLGQYKFRSESFKSVQSHLTALKSFPVPLAYPFLYGIDWGKYREETGKGFGSMYLFGQLKPEGGFKGYYFFAYLYKEPIAIQILILLAVIFYVRNRRRYSFMRNELFLVIPVIFYGIYMNFFFKIQIGIRHYLVVFPFLYIFCGSLVSGWGGNKDAVPISGGRGLGRKMKIAIVALLVYLVVSVLSYFPHYIPYFNELVRDRKQAYKILADSNIDWGQGLSYAKQYVAKHPGAYLEQGLWHMKTYREKHMEEYLHPQFPDSGLLVVNVNNYVGIYHPHRYKWLRERYKPIDQIAYSYLVFRILPGDSIKTTPVEMDEPVPDSPGESDGAR
jgi:hypothetical protein